MKAYVLHGIDDFRLEDVPEPKLKEGEVLVEVKAAGICGSDIPRVYKTGTYSYPLIPGHEFSGVVVKAQKGTDGRWKGQRVGIFPLIPCVKCGPCRKKQYEMCRSYSYLGSRRDGGFAQYAAVPEKNLILLPEQVTFEEGAMLEPMAVAVHAIRKSAFRPGDKVAVLGLGTIGLLLTAFLLEAGAGCVLAVGNKDFQRETALKLGLPRKAYCDSRSQDVSRWIGEQTDGQGADLFFECVGKNETVSLAVDCAAPAGRVCLVGNPYSEIKLEKPVYWKILRNQLTVRGTWNSSFHYGQSPWEPSLDFHGRERGEEGEEESKDDWHYVLDRLAGKRIAPAALITNRFPFTELEKGFRIMRDKQEEYGKIMGLM